MGWVYAIESRGLIKIGMSKSVTGRFYAIAGANPGCRLIGKVQVPNARAAELYAHKKLKAHAVGHEWFEISVEQALAALEEAHLCYCDEPPNPNVNTLRSIRGLALMDHKR